MAALAVAVAGGVIYVSPTGNEGTAESATAGAPAYVMPDCDPVAPDCQRRIDAALQAWAIAQGGVLPEPTPEPSTSSPAPSTSSPAPSPSTSTPAPSPSTTAPTTPPPATGQALIGMSSPQDQWAQRVAEVGPGLEARRIFRTGFDASLNLAQQACSANLYPVISFKTGGPSWSQVASGSQDAALRSLAARLAALPCDVFVAIHHEPAVSGHPPAGESGTPAQWAAMQVHALPILGASPEVEVGVIGNGWWWDSTGQSYSDAEIAQFITPAVRSVSDVIAADTYEGTTLPGVKIRRMTAWAQRVGVSSLGLGEFNGTSGNAITDACNAVAADPRFAWGNVFNSDVGAKGVVLSGSMLTAFQNCIR